ncbi:hypothetical protein EG327_004368 [Venturia inaequalis]|uniref:Uncharacterized protein n=1 Tax=Venturia inaequalis TaxID=5025 RepID=A0A8H3VED6_VENIN|nr:hypothetical protein EG327_004368 [Venturia inaequalis]
MIRGPGMKACFVDVDQNESSKRPSNHGPDENCRVRYTAASLTADPVDDNSSEPRRVDTRVEDGLEGRISFHDMDFSDNQTNQTVLPQLCQDQKAGVVEANHEKKQLMSNLPDEQSLPVAHKVCASPLHHLSQPITQQYPADVLRLPGTPLTNSSANTPGSEIPLVQTGTSDAVLNNEHETRHHGTVHAEPETHHSHSVSPGSDSSNMSSVPVEPIASAKDIGMPTVVDIPADAKSVAILKTIKADNIKRAGSTATFIPQGTSNAEKAKRAGASAISISQGTSRDFHALCTEWGIKTEAPFTFQNAIEGLFGKALTSALSARSSILGQISHLCVLPEKSSLVMLKNSPFHWISSTSLEFQILEETPVQYGGETIIILSANVKIDYSEDGTFSVLLSASRLGDDDRTWSWLESNVGLVARFQYEQVLLPVTLSHTGKNVLAELNHLDGITVLDLVQALRLPLGALINLPLVGRMLKSVLTCASFEYGRLLDRSSPPSILTGRVVYHRERLQLGSFDLSDPEFSIVYSSSRSLVSVDEGQWTFQISALHTALKLKTQVDYAAIDYLARFHVQPKATVGLIDFLKLLAPNQIKAASQKALTDFTIDRADVVLDTSDWSAISCSGDMRFPGGLPSLFEYDAYSSNDIALTSTIEVDVHGYDVDALAFQSFFDSRPEVLAQQKETTFAIEDDEIMVAAPLNNDELWKALALAVKEHAPTDGTIIDSGRDEVLEVVSSTPSHITSDTEVKDDGVTFLKIHRASVLQFATAVVPGSPLPSPTIVTIASGTDGSAGGSARRASRLISSMSASSLVVVPSVGEEVGVIEEHEKGIDGDGVGMTGYFDDQVVNSRSDIFASTRLDLPTQNGNQVSSLSIVTDSTVDGENLGAIPEKSVTSSTFPSPSPSVASSSPKFEQRELYQKSSTSSLGSEIQTFNKCTLPEPTLHTTSEDKVAESGLLADVQDSQLIGPGNEVSTVAATSTPSSSTTEKLPVAEDILGFDFSDAFGPSMQLEPSFANERASEHEVETEYVPIAKGLIHAFSPNVASEDIVSPILESVDLKNVSPTTESDHVEEVEDETPIEEEPRPQRVRRDRTERRPARRVREPASLEEISETSAPSIATPREQVASKPTPKFAEYSPSEDISPTTTSPPSPPPKSIEASKAYTTIAATDDIRPIQSTTSDPAHNKRSRRKSLLPSKSMRNLLRRVSSFGNLKEQPLPLSPNIPTSHSDTAVPLPPLVMNGSFVSGTTEGWQVNAGRNTIKILKEEPKGYKHKLVVTVRRSSLSGACLRQRLATEVGSKLRFSLKLKYDAVGDGVLSVLIDGKIVARHQASSGQGEIFDIQGSFVCEKRGTLLELEMKSPFGKMMVFEISRVVVERVGSESFVNGAGLLG